MQGRETSGRGISDLQQDHIFALDIGTRSVVGIIAAKAAESEELEILDVEMLEHPERSMIGGQIHDIPRVAETVFRIKRTFEINITLN